MTIYSTKAAKLLVEPITNSCPNCQTVHTMDMHIFQKYASVFGIPFFPISKTGVALCTHCMKTLKRKQMPQQVLNSFKEVESQANVPLWTWAGTFLLLCTLLLSVIYNQGALLTQW